MTTPTDHHPSNPTESETIDRLLQHYLTLLDEYTSLRSTLNTLQSSIFRSLARANFAAERGVRRYGQDYYDERMQAGRRITVRSEKVDGECVVEGGGAAREGEKRKKEVRIEGPVFTVGLYPPPEPEAARRLDPGDRKKGEDKKEEDEERSSTDVDAVSKPEKQPDVTDEDEDSRNEDTQRRPTHEENSPGKSTNNNHNNHKKPADPLRWFGILTPLPLRQAQQHAIQAVEDIIPRLATLSSEMARVELEVRRARKRRAKAEKQAEKEAEKKKVAEIEDKMGKVDVGA